MAEKNPHNTKTMQIHRQRVNINSIKATVAQVAAGLELGSMEGRVCELLHEEDYSLEEVAGLLGVQQEFIRTNILTPNTQDIHR